MIEWHHITSGSGKIPILFLHGFMGRAEDWTETFKYLPKKFKAYAIDLPGHGRTKADLDKLTFNTLANSLIEFLQYYSNDQWLICGYSLGGRVALHTALNYPDNFRGMILESANPGIKSAEARTNRLKFDKVTARKLAQSNMPGFLEFWYNQAVFSHLSDELRAGLIAEKSSGNPKNLAAALTALSQGNQVSLWSRLKKWPHPSLVMAGEKDRKYTEIALEMDARLPDNQLAIIPGAGHITHLENHKAFRSALKSFLNGYII